jgi:hypothetical protein
LGGLGALSPTKFEVRNPNKGLATISALKAMCKILDPPLQGFLLEECVQYGPRGPCMVSLHCVTNPVRLQHSIVIAELLEEDRSIAHGEELLGFVLYFDVLDRRDLESQDHWCLIVMNILLALLIELVFIDS